MVSHGGRAKSWTTRDLLQCPVEGCNVKQRQDNLNRHLISSVEWDNGTPLAEHKKTFKELSKIKKLHTNYFSKHGYSIGNLPVGKVSNPNSIAKFFTKEEMNSNNNNNKRKRSIDRENEDEEHVDDPENEENENMNRNISKVAKNSLHEHDHDDELNISVEKSDPSHSEVNKSPSISIEGLLEFEDNNENIFEDRDIDTASQDVRGTENSLLSQSCPERNKIISPLNDEQLELLGISLFDKIKGLIKNEEISNKIDQNDYDKFWIENEDFYVCKVCISSENFVEKIPPKLLSLKRGNFGFISRGKINYHVNKNKLIHETNELHKYLVNTYLKHKDSSDKFNELNKKAASLVIMNCYQCLQTGGSSVDFLRMNDRDMLASNIMKTFTAANKNNSVKEFFDLREILFLNLSKNIKEQFQRVKSFSITLDKVTIGNVSFTVIVSMFFGDDGRLHTLCNQIYKMNTNDYSGRQTSQMILKCLVDTLGLSIQGKLK